MFRYSNYVEVGRTIKGFVQTNKQKIWSPNGHRRSNTFSVYYATSNFLFLASKNGKIAGLGASICTYHSHLCFRERSFFSVLIINDGNRNFVGDRGTSKKEIDWVQNSSGLLCLFFLSQYKID